MIMDMWKIPFLLMGIIALIIVHSVGSRAKTDGDKLFTIIIGLPTLVYVWFIFFL